MIEAAARELTDFEMIKEHLIQSNSKSKFLYIELPNRVLSLLLLECRPPFFTTFARTFYGSSYITTSNKDDLIKMSSELTEKYSPASQELFKELILVDFVSKQIFTQSSDLNSLGGSLLKKGYTFQPITESTTWLCIIELIFEPVKNQFDRQNSQPYSYGSDPNCILV